MSSVEPTGEAVVRPEGFGLAEAWRLIADEVDRRRAPVLASALVAPDAVWLCRSIFGSRVRIGPAGDDGRVEVELRGHTARSLAAEAAGLGALVEILGPPEVCEHLAAVGAELVALYGTTALVVHEATVVAAPVELVWATIVDDDRRAAWWPYLHLDARPGGGFEERWTDGGGTPVVTSGDVLDLDPPRQLRLSWRDDGWPVGTEVELRLEPRADGTLVTVRHTGWSALPDAGVLVAQHRAGWRAHLDHLRSAV